MRVTVISRRTRSTRLPGIGLPRTCPIHLLFPSTSDRLVGTKMSSLTRGIQYHESKDPRPRSRRSSDRTFFLNVFSFPKETPFEQEEEREEICSSSPLRFACLSSKVSDRHVLLKGLSLVSVTSPMSPVSTVGNPSLASRRVFVGATSPTVTPLLSERSKSAVSIRRALSF